ncbi:hypothetical protein EON68_03770, partial [archaeon]
MDLDVRAAAHAASGVPAPAVVHGAPRRPSSATPASPWRRVVALDTGAVYYYHTKSKERRWELPVHVETPAQAHAVPAAQLRGAAANDHNAAAPQLDASTSACSVGTVFTWKGARCPRGGGLMQSPNRESVLPTTGGAARSEDDNKPASMTAGDAHLEHDVRTRMHNAVRATLTQLHASRGGGVHDYAVHQSGGRQEPGMLHARRPNSAPPTPSFHAQDGMARAREGAARAVAAGHAQLFAHHPASRANSSASLLLCTPPRVPRAGDAHVVPAPARFDANMSYASDVSAIGSVPRSVCGEYASVLGDLGDLGDLTAEVEGRDGLRADVAALSAERETVHSPAFAVSAAAAAA